MLIRVHDITRCTSTVNYAEQNKLTVHDIQSQCKFSTICVDAQVMNVIKFPGFVSDQ